MALPVSIDRLISGEVVESTRVELMGGFNPNPIMHGICAFANDIDNIGGGYLVIGIDEQDGRPVLPHAASSTRMSTGYSGASSTSATSSSHCTSPSLSPSSSTASG